MCLFLFRSHDLFYVFSLTQISAFPLLATDEEKERKSATAFRILRILFPGVQRSTNVYDGENYYNLIHQRLISLKYFDVDIIG